MDSLDTYIFDYVLTFSDVHSISNLCKTSKSIMSRCTYILSILKFIVTNVIDLKSKGLYKIDYQGYKKDRCNIIDRNYNVCLNKVKKDRICKHHTQWYESKEYSYMTVYDYRLKMIHLCTKMNIDNSQILNLTTSIWQSNNSVRRIIVTTIPIIPRYKGKVISLDELIRLKKEYHRYFHEALSRI